MPLSNESASGLAQGVQRKPRRRLRWLARIASWLGVLIAVLATLAIASGWRAFGKRPSGARLARMERSPQWQDGKFVNSEPMENDLLRAILGVFRASPFTTPSAPVPTVPVDPKLFQIPPATGLRVTWFGHSAFLVEIDGYRVLVDPVWSLRIGPMSWSGPKRWYGPLIALGDLPSIDVVVISHDHYDHLD